MNTSGFKLRADVQHMHIKKGMIKVCLYVLFPSSTSSTYIALQPLGVFDLSLTSSTCFDIHKI